MEHISHLVLTYGYALIFILVFLDQAAVSIPSPPFVAALGALASRGRFNIFFAFAIVFAAGFAADYAWFRFGASAAGRVSHSARYRRWSGKFPHVFNLVRRGAIGAALSVKFSLIPSAFVPLAAGSIRLTMRQFLPMAAAGNLAWTAAFLLGGFTAGHAIIGVFSHTGIVIAATAGFCLLFIFPAAARWATPYPRERSVRRN
jgi:membrane protein DedA with SNARE-associated domain